jgi:[ribosomal protein S5]-alanine N-acetyltransferase
MGFVLNPAYSCLKEMQSGVMNRIPFELPILRTPRLVLRTMTSKDSVDLFAIYGDQNVMRYASDEPFPSIATVAQMLLSVESLRREGISLEWGIELVRTGHLIGTCGLHSFNSETSTAEVGCILAQKYWGQGLMREALQTLCVFSAEQLGIRRLRADIDEPNQRSKVLFARLGFHLQQGTTYERELTPTNA